MVAHCGAFLEKCDGKISEESVEAYKAIIHDERVVPTLKKSRKKKLREVVYHGQQELPQL